MANGKWVIASSMSGSGGLAAIREAATMAADPSV